MALARQPLYQDEKSGAMMNPLVSTPSDVAFAVLATFSIVMAIVALFMVWQEERVKRDVARAILLSILTLFVPFIGAIVAMMSVKTRQSIGV